MPNIPGYCLFIQVPLAFFKSSPNLAHVTRSGIRAVRCMSFFSTLRNSTRPYLTWQKALPCRSVHEALALPGTTSQDVLLKNHPTITVKQVHNQGMYFQNLCWGYATYVICFSRLQLQGEVAAGDTQLAYRGMFRTCVGIATEEVNDYFKV